VSGARLQCKQEHGWRLELRGREMDCLLAGIFIYKKR
jgi:hypothetical protein